MIENRSKDIGCLLEVKDGKTAEVIELCSNVKVREKIQSSSNLNNFKEKVPIILSEINIDSNIENERKKELVQLLNEYRDCFALNISELGSNNLTKVDIKEVEGSKPVCIKPYKTNAPERAAIKEIVREWRENCIVSDTRSPYASPVLLVKKKTGENRLVIDYRRLNSQTIKDNFPLSKIDDLLEQLHDYSFFTTLDLAHGYLQIPLTENAKQKTAFITPDETGQFERMIFGLTNATAEFQRFMCLALGPLCNLGVLCYLSDILIPALTWEEMIEILIEVFERLRSANFTLKLPKCKFGKQEVEYLGFIINKNGIKPGSRKLEAISKFPQPKSIHDVRRFLDLTNFCRRFIPNYAIKVRYVTQLTKKN
ncbi:Retrovirus-related Pol polyprotein from transposon 17.6 [Araneus ventricosus]|uniref:Retrovirus-related Pol polyprotein from transposon 17.6 n=1 Tax=Araneus ventricosus TaxID=182803 RepID=A0A4Y2FL23_ARAVE|nr:Retrovirus-related Pol polyprotein from transposon 17.6 [Araneus ventricosus]